MIISALWSVYGLPDREPGSHRISPGLPSKICCYATLHLPAWIGLSWETGEFLERHPNVLENATQAPLLLAISVSHQSLFSEHVTVMDASQLLTLMFGKGNTSVLCKLRNSENASVT